jgi:hypothetical protein
METVHITSWNEFVARTSECDGWAFRGLPDADWQLLSSLSRYLHSFVPDRSTWRQREERALRIFRRKRTIICRTPACRHWRTTCAAWR